MNFRIHDAGALHLTTLFFTILLASSAANAGLSFDEAVSGDVLGGINPIGTLEAGINTISGSISGSSNGDGGDRFDVELPPGLEIVGIDYTISGFSAVNAGDRGAFFFLPARFPARLLDADGTFEFPSASFPVTGPFATSDYLFMRDHQLAGMEVAYDYVITIDVHATGTVIDSDTTGSFDVMPGDNVTVTSGATLTGDVTVDGGVFTLEDGATLVGNILGTQGGDIIVTSGATVNGNIEHTAGTLTIDAATVQGDTIREQTNHTIIRNGALLLGELNFVDPGLVEISGATVTDGILIDITGQGIHETADLSFMGLDATSNILIDITGQGVTRDLLLAIEQSTVDGNLSVTTSDQVELETIGVSAVDTASDGILIDITGAGITGIDLDNVAVSEGILIDITGAGLQTSAGVALAEVTSGNNILIDLTGVGLTRQVDVTGGVVGNQLQVKGSSSVNVMDATVVKHLKVKKSDFANITGSEIGKNLLFLNRRGSCTASGNQVSGRTIGC